MRWPSRREIWIGSTLLAAILVWSGRFVVNPDGISYLDLSDDVRAGHFADAVNAHWSPGYPYLLALWLSPLSPGSAWESTAVHVLNGVLFLGALAAFEFFLRELEKSQPQSQVLALPLNKASGRFAAYSIFLWCALVLITIRAVTPDMLVALLGFLAAGLFVRIRSDRAGTPSYVAFGLTLGLAALTKSFMIPAAIMMIAFAAVRRRNVKRLLVSFALFLVVIAPQVTALSVKSGRVTAGDSARIVYLLKVNKVPKLGNDILYFPTDKPNQTYPAWDDPTILFRGLSPSFDMTDQSAALGKNLVTLGGVALKILVPLMLVVAMRDVRSRMQNRLLALAAAVVISAYLFLHTEARLVGFWLVLLTVSVLAGLTLSPTRHRLGRGFVHLITIVSVISFVTFTIAQAFSSRPDRGFSGRNVSSVVADQVNRSGIPRGSRIALVGDESDIYWARLARVQIAAQIPLRAAKSYASLPTDALERINQQLADAGARGIVASWTPAPINSRGWVQVGEFSIFSFNDNLSNGRIRTQ